MRAAIYARVSTDEQSAEAQIRDLRRYAGQREWGVVGEFVDEGVSGAKRQRDGLDALMAGARRRDFDIVLVWRFDRFARSSRHLVDALETFRSLGVQFVSFQEQIDTGSPMGEAMFTIIAAMAQLERNLIRERVKMGLRNAREKGQRLGRPNQWGEEELQRVADLRREGKSIRSISTELGIPKTTVGRHLKSLS
jgi:DNA invertase Pin-like site-specific DNA recombinase